MVHPRPTPFSITECPYLSLLLPDFVLYAVRFSISVFRAHGSIVGDCAFNMNRSRLLGSPRSEPTTTDVVVADATLLVRASVLPRSEPTTTDVVDADATLLGPTLGASCCKPPPRRPADEDFCTPEQSVLDLLVGEPH